MRENKKYPMYPERLRLRLLQRDANRPPVTPRAPEPSTDEWSDSYEDGNFFKGLLVALALSIPFWVLVGFVIRWTK